MMMTIAMVVLKTTTRMMERRKINWKNSEKPWKEKTKELLSI